MMKFICLLVFFSAVSFGSAGSELSVIQDLFNAKSRSALALGQIKISENELKRNRELFLQIKMVKEKAIGAVSEYEYRESELAVVTSGFNIVEAKELYEAARADERVHEAVLKTLSGEKITTKQIKDEYVAMWSARGKAAKAVLGKNEAEVNFALFNRDMVARLFVKNAASAKELIIAEHDLTKAEESVQRAKDVVQVTEEAMKKFQ